VHQFSLPRMAVLKAKVDQPNNVAAVVSSPSPAEIASYLRRTLPAAGFTITADNPAAKTLTFIGNGWTGSFTGDNNGVSAVSAVLLRPH
jgi:predicted CoA-binding protein